MLYTSLLTIHSVVRWALLILYVAMLFRAAYGFHWQKNFGKADNVLLRSTTSVAHLQLIIGITLYFVSPIVDYFLHNFGAAVGQKQFRFFGMEHGVMMLLSVVLITIAGAKAKRKPDSSAKFKTIVIWYVIALLLMLGGLPR